MAVACIQSEKPHPPATGSGGNGGGGGGNSGGGGISGSGAAPGETPGTGGALPDSTACGQLTVDNCASSSMCAVLSGQRIIDSPACVLPLQMVICGTNQGCMTASVRATDLQNMDWVFPSTCIPAGWTDASSKGTHFDACSSAAGGNPSPDAGAP